MARVFITGSTAGLGKAAARTLLEEGHEAVVHARSAERRKAVDDLIERGAAVVVGDLSDQEQARSVARQVNRLGRMDAVIHNAGVISGPQMFAINVIAPYLLTVLIERPARLVYLSSSMHGGGRADLTAFDRAGRGGQGSYADTKLLLTALAFAVARIWNGVFSNAVDPGWVPTRMGGPSATDDLRLGHLTQVWLATSEDLDACTSGGYWYHRHRAEPAPVVEDRRFQDDLVDGLARFTGERVL